MRLPWSGTFHSIANRLIREYAQALGIAPDFSVLDRGDAADLIDLCATSAVFRRKNAVSRGRTPALRSIRTA